MHYYNHAFPAPALCVSVAGFLQTPRNHSVTEPSQAMNGGACPAPLPERGALHTWLLIRQVFMKPRQKSPLPGFFFSCCRSRFRYSEPQPMVQYLLQSLAALVGVSGK